MSDDAVGVKRVGRKCTYNFVHTVNGHRQSNGHVMSLPDYVEDGTEKIIAFVRAMLAIQGYKAVSGLEIDIEDIYQKL